MQPKMAFNTILNIPSTQLNTTTVSRQLITWCYEDAVFPCGSIMIADWLSPQLVKISIWSCPNCVYGDETKRGFNRQDSHDD